MNMVIYTVFAIMISDIKFRWMWGKSQEAVLSTVDCRTTIMRWIFTCGQLNFSLRAIVSLSSLNM